MNALPGDPSLPPGATRDEIEQTAPTCPGCGRKSTNPDMFTEAYPCPECGYPEHDPSQQGPFE